MSLAEFLDWDDGTDTLYELVEGRIVAMAPPNDAHGTIIRNIGLAIGPALKAPCRIVGNAGIVLPERDDRYYVADLAVTCDQPASQRRFLPEPRLIVEVLSRSTAAHDRGLKGEDYRQLASVQEILFVSNDERRVVRLRREVDHWAIDDFHRRRFGAPREHRRDHVALDHLRQRRVWRAVNSGSRFGVRGSSTAAQEACDSSALAATRQAIAVSSAHPQAFR
jgi:Uma2 family endonuclease